jgi:hypothetical protein
LSNPFDDVTKYLIVTTETGKTAYREIKVNICSPQDIAPESRELTFDEKLDMSEAYNI